MGKVKPLQEPNLTLLSILAAEYAADASAGRYAMDGVVYLMSPKGLDLVATDGHTMFCAHLDALASHEPVGGRLTVKQALAGKEPDMVKPGEEGYPQGFPPYAKVLEPATKAAQGKEAIVVDTAGWEDFGAMVKLWVKKLNPQAYCPALHLHPAPEGLGWELFGSQPDFGEMLHRLMWPRGKDRNIPKGVGINGVYALRLAETAVKLNRPLSFWATDNDTKPHAAHVAWGSGSATLIVMPCRM